MGNSNKHPADAVPGLQDQHGETNMNAAGAQVIHPPPNVDQVAEYVEANMPPVGAQVVPPPGSMAEVANYVGANMTPVAAQAMPLPGRIDQLAQSVQVNMPPKDAQVMLPPGGVDQVALPQQPSQSTQPESTEAPGRATKDEAGPSVTKKKGKKIQKKKTKANKTAPKGGEQKQTGRKKIKIEYMNDSRARQVSFLKRKNGVLKKAYELSVLTGCETAVVMFSNDNQKLYQFTSATAEQTLNKYAEYTGPSERRLCLTVGDEGFTGKKKSKAGSSSKTPSTSKACVKSKAGSSSKASNAVKVSAKSKCGGPSKALKPAKGIAKSKRGSSSKASNAVKVPANGEASAQSLARPVQSFAPPAQTYGPELRTVFPGRELQYDRIGVEHGMVHVNSIYGQPNTVHFQGAVGAVETGAIAVQNAATRQNAQFMLSSFREDGMGEASQAFPVQEQLPNMASNEETGISEFLDTETPLSAEDEQLIDFLEAEIAVDNAGDAGAVAPTRQEFEEAGIFNPTDLVHDALLVFPTESENMGGFGQFEREHQVAPFIFPLPRASETIGLPGAPLHGLPSTEHEMQTNRHFAPTDLSRFGRN